MHSLHLHAMKKLEVVIEGEHLPFLQDLMGRAGLSGYTLVRDVAGMGHHGVHAGRLVYNDLGSYVMAIAVGPDIQVITIVEALKPFFAEHPGVMFLSDTSVIRSEYFRAA